MNKMPNNYYSVKIGRIPGIYLTWKECEENIKGYSKSKYKKFKSIEKAEDYLKNTDLKTNIEKKYEGLVLDDYEFNNCVNIYTDGSCINNGNPDAVGGYGIYFGEKNLKNVSKQIKPKKHHPITNNRAELKAILEAFKIIVNDIMDDNDVSDKNNILDENNVLDKNNNGNKQIVIHTDSMYCIQVLLGEPTYKKILQGKNIANSDYIKKGIKFLKEYPQIKFHHVLAHTGKKDEHSIGNENADKLANESIKGEIEKIKMNYGKYKDMELMEIYKMDSKYLQWCVINKKNQIHDIKLFLSMVENEK
jgi:ribonuclease HI